MDETQFDIDNLIKHGKASNELIQRLIYETKLVHMKFMRGDHWKEQSKNMLQEQFETTKQEIVERARHDPLLYNILHQWQYGDITWEQAMTMLVLALSKQNEQLQKQYTKSLMESPNYIFPPTTK